GVEKPLFEGMLIAKEPENQGAHFPLSLLQEALDACTALARRVEHLEHDKRFESSADTIMEDVSNQGRMTEESDKDEATKVVNEEEKTEEEESSTNTPTETKSKDKGKGILVEEPKPMKKKQQVEMDEAFARKLQEELNQEINWEVAMEHVKQSAKESLYVKRYQVMKKRPVNALMYGQDNVWSMLNALIWSRCYNRRWLNNSKCVRSP
nr:hypothetical protein [Tanacetum cinerariifolium]